MAVLKDKEKQLFLDVFNTNSPVDIKRIFEHYILRMYRIKETMKLRPQDTYAKKHFFIKTGKILLSFGVRILLELVKTTFFKKTFLPY